jgi:hypothetical protein
MNDILYGGKSRADLEMDRRLALARVRTLADYERINPPVPRVRVRDLARSRHENQAPPTP